MGISLILYTYCLSFCFNKVKTTATWFTLINVLTGFAMTAVLMIPELHFLRWGIYLHPLYDMAVVVMQMPDQQIG